MNIHLVSHCYSTKRLDGLTGAGKFLLISLNFYKFVNSSFKHYHKFGLPTSEVSNMKEEDYHLKLFERFIVYDFK